MRLFTWPRGGEWVSHALSLQCWTALEFVGTVC